MVDKEEQIKNILRKYCKIDYPCSKCYCNGKPSVCYADMALKEILYISLPEDGDIKQIIETCDRVITDCLLYKDGELNFNDIEPDLAVWNNYRAQYIKELL